MCSESLGLVLPSTILFDYPSVEALCGYILATTQAPAATAAAAATRRSGSGSFSSRRGSSLMRRLSSSLPPGLLMSSRRHTVAAAQPGSGGGSSIGPGGTAAVVMHAAAAARLITQQHQQRRRTSMVGPSGLRTTDMGQPIGERNGFRTWFVVCCCNLCSCQARMSRACCFPAPGAYPVVFAGRRTSHQHQSMFAHGQLAALPLGSRRATVLPHPTAAAVPTLQVG